MVRTGEYFNRMLLANTRRRKQQQHPEVPDLPAPELDSQIDDCKALTTERRWRLCETTLDGIRVFVEEERDDFPAGVPFWGVSWTIPPSALALASLAAWWVSPRVGVRIAAALALSSMFFVFIARRQEQEKRSSLLAEEEEKTAPWRRWVRTGRVRASTYVEASADDVFHLVRGRGLRRESEWSADFEEMRVVEVMDRHTEIVELVEKTSPLGWRKLLSWHSRYAKLLRYWRRDEDGGYSLVAQSVETNWSLEEHHCCLVTMEVKGSIFEMRPAIAGDGVVVTEACDVDAGLSFLSYFFCNVKSIPAFLRLPHSCDLAVTWSARRVRDRLRGLKACAAQLVDDDPLKSSFRPVSSLCVGATELYVADDLAVHHGRPKTCKVPPHLASDDDSVSSKKVRGISSSSSSSSSSSATAVKVVAPPPPSTTSTSTSTSTSTRQPSTRSTQDDDFGAALKRDQGTRPRRRDFQRSSRPMEPNRWDEPPAEQFRVRGPTYLEDGKKVPATKARCRLVAVDALRTTGSKPLMNVGRRATSTMELSATDVVVVINFMLPHETKAAPHVSLVFTYVDSKEDAAFSKRLVEFIRASKAERDESFKLIPFLQDGPWIAKHALGHKPALIGRGIAVHYFTTPNFIEVDVDVASSSVANGVWRIMKGAAKALVVDLAFVLEGKTKEQLPEVLLGTVRLQYFDFARKENPAYTHVDDSFLETENQDPPPASRSEPTKTLSKMAHTTSSETAKAAAPPAKKIKSQNNNNNNTR